MSSFNEQGRQGQSLSQTGMFIANKPMKPTLMFKKMTGYSLKGGDLIYGRSYYPIGTGNALPKSTLALI
jgi:hypothetical protein